MANPDFPLQGYQINGWTVSKNGNNWQAINKFGETGTTSLTEGTIVSFARTNKADKRLVK